MSFLKLSLIFSAVIVSSICYASEQRKLEHSLHQYYQLNININHYWMNDNNKKYKDKAEKSLEKMNLAMSDLIKQKYAAAEYSTIEDNWIKLNHFIKKTSFIEKGYSDIALIASYRVLLDKVRLAMLHRYHQNPPTSDIAKLLTLFNRIISTYVETNTDVFGSFIRSAADGDMKFSAIADEIDFVLIKIAKSNAMSQEDFTSMSTKWNFIRNTITDSSSQSLPFIVLLNGQKIIKTLEYYEESDQKNSL